jgi:hypothetical protein
METPVKRTKKNALSKGIARICSSTIEWSLNGKDLALSAIDMELITNALIENRLEGELCTIAPNGTIVGGYWNIQWKQIN